MGLNVLSLNSSISQIIQLSLCSKYVDNILAIHKPGYLIAAKKTKDKNITVHVFHKKLVYDLYSYENTLITAKPYSEIDLCEILKYAKKHTNFRKLYIVCSEKDLGNNNDLKIVKDYAKFSMSNDDPEFLSKFRIILTCNTGKSLYLFTRNNCQKHMVEFKNDTSENIYVGTDNYFTRKDNINTTPCAIIQYGNSKFDKEIIASILDMASYM